MAADAQRRRLRGFTLLEVLVVLLLVGIVVGVAASVLRTPDERQRIEQEAQRLRALLQLASEEALLQARTYGVRLHRTGYEFAVRGRHGWRTMDQQPFQARTLSPGVRLAPDDVPGEARTPQILLFADGTFTPFTLEFVSGTTDIRQRLQGTEDGEIGLPAP